MVNQNMDSCIFCTMTTRYGSRRHNGTCRKFKHYISRLRNEGDCKWTILGDYFGYPQCCIRSFVKRGRERTVGSSRRSYVSNKYVGFIQCKRHRKIRNKVNVLANAKKRRRCLRAIDDSNIRLYPNLHGESKILDDLLEKYYSAPPRFTKSEPPRRARREPKRIVHST